MGRKNGVDDKVLEMHTAFVKIGMMRDDAMKYAAQKLGDNIAMIQALDEILRLSDDDPACKAKDIAKKVLREIG